MAGYTILHFFLHLLALIHCIHGVCKVNKDVGAYWQHVVMMMVKWCKFAIPTWAEHAIQVFAK